MRKILIGLGVAVVAVIVVVFLRSAGHRAAATGLDRALANLPPGMTATHGAAAYDPILGTFSVADLTIMRNGAPVFSAARVQASGVARGDGDAPPKRVGHVTLEDASFPPGRHAARIELDGLALADLRDVLDPAYYPGGKPAWTDRRVLLEHGDLVDVSLERTTPGGKGTGLARVGHVHVDRLAGRPFDVPPTPENRQRPDFWVAVTRATAEKSASVEKIDISEPNAEHVSIGAETVDDVDAGRVGTVRVQDVRAEATGQGSLFKLADLSLGGLDITAALPKLAKLANAPGDAGNLLFGALRITKLHATGADMSTPTGIHVQLASVDGDQDIQPDGRKSGVFALRTLSLAFDHAVLPPMQQAALQRFGMSVFVIDLDFASTYDPDGARTKLSRFDLAVRDLGTLHVTGEASCPAFDGATRDRAATMRALQQTVLGKASFRWDDGSLTNRIIDAAAKSRGSTPEAIRMQMTMMTMALPMIFPDQPDAAAQVNAFVANPKWITLTMTPPRPIALMDVAAAPAPQRAGLLGAHIQAE